MIKFTLRTPSSLRGALATLVALLLTTLHAHAADLHVMNVGLGSGSVGSNPAGIACGTTCDASFGAGASVTLTASAPTTAFAFVRWHGDCAGTMPTCTLLMGSNRSVRAEFRPNPVGATISDFTAKGDPTVSGSRGIQGFLDDNTGVTTPAQFIAALPPEFRRNWILMTRSESLQTGTARSPRILLPSADARFVFSVGVTEHSAYPGSHPNAIEYMQWDAAQRNFRFHEIVLGHIDPLGSVPARERGVSADDTKCSKCHSTRNVLNLNRTVTPAVPGSSPATDGVPPGTVQSKNKPNWDAYDSWGGMMPFNRDRIYQGSVEAAAFRKILNPWTWRSSPAVRAVVEQLELQPPDQFLAGGALDSARSIPRNHIITRSGDGATPEANDGQINFAFDTLPPVLIEPPVSGSPTTAINYSFNRTFGSGTGTTVTRGGTFITLHHSSIATSDEGRGVRFFDALGGLAGTLNQQRVADEIVNHRFATGSVPIDVRPLALAISRRCLQINRATTPFSVTPALPAAALSFFQARNGGMTIAQVLADTDTRATASTPESLRLPSLPRRKADLQKFNLDRTGDYYLFAAENGLFQEYGANTTVNPMDTMTDRLRREVYRRPTPGACTTVTGNCPDSTVMRSNSVDREDYNYNTDRIALYRFFLEPLGVAVDKWSMNVRGRSRSYNFADVFSTYANQIEPRITADLAPGARPIPGLSNPNDCGQLITAIGTTMASLPAADAVPTYTDVQRIFNKSCIECHGGLGYPPYGPGSLDFSEDESPPAMTPPLVSARMARSYSIAEMNTIAGDAANSPIYQKITETSEDCTPASIGLMPCGGPPLSKVDVETIRRWIMGPPTRPSTAGDPHIKTVTGTNYDFQSAGEFVLLRDEFFEVQARQTAVPTEAPLGANAHTGLSSCVSLNSAVAVRMGPHRITYQPNLNGRPDPEGLQLHIDGKLQRMSKQGIPLASGGRVMQTSAPGGIQIESPGGTAVVVTPNWWDHHRLWYMNIDVQRARATQGVMGAIAPGDWLPALPNGMSLGARPNDPHQRYLDLYERFADAWRVTGTSSLFDYAAGTSTATFTIDSWPLENARTCIVPRDREAPPPIAPTKPLALEIAQQQCRVVKADDRRANCEADVVATGEIGFAKAYLLTEQIDRNAAPAATTLMYPPKNSAELTLPITFKWDRARDTDGDTVSYRVCVWLALDRPNNNTCETTGIQTIEWRSGVLCALVVLVIGALVLALLIYFGLRHRHALLRVIAIATLLLALLAFYFCGIVGAKTVSKTVPALESGKAYLWKVIAEDGKGGTTHSETRRFTVK